MTHPNHIATIWIAKITKEVADMIRHEALSGQTAYAIAKKPDISKNTAKKYVNDVPKEHGLKNRKRPSNSCSLEKLEAMTCVCSVGLDMIAIPGDTSPYTISGIIADDAMAIGMINNNTAAVRLVPVYGKLVQETVTFGGLLGYALIMPVNQFSCTDFIRRGGRIPAPVHSFKI